jgi:hypothetical protein
MDADGALHGRVSREGDASGQRRISSLSAGVVRQQVLTHIVMTDKNRDGRDLRIAIDGAFEPTLDNEGNGGLRIDEGMRVFIGGSAARASMLGVVRFAAVHHHVLGPNKARAHYLHGPPVFLGTDDDDGDGLHNDVDCDDTLPNLNQSTCP